MHDQFLGEADYARMGLSHAGGIELQTWALERVGFVLDKGAFGGSGIFVTTCENERALLTARHVVIRSILAGEVSIGAYDRGKSASKSGRAITFSSSCGRPEPCGCPVSPAPSVAPISSRPGPSASRVHAAAGCSTAAAASGAF